MELEQEHGATLTEDAGSIVQRELLRPFEIELDESGLGHAELKDQFVGPKRGNFFDDQRFPVVKMPAAAIGAGSGAPIGGKLDRRVSESHRLMANFDVAPPIEGGQRREVGVILGGGLENDDPPARSYDLPENGRIVTDKGATVPSDRSALQIAPEGESGERVGIIVAEPIGAFGAHIEIQDSAFGRTSQHTQWHDLLPVHPS